MTLIKSSDSSRPCLIRHENSLVSTKNLKLQKLPKKEGTSHFLTYHAFQGPFQAMKSKYRRLESPTTYLQSQWRKPIQKIQLFYTKTKCHLDKMKWEVILWLFLGSPIVAFIYCLTLAYVQGHSTRTHCGASEFAVSVSEATAVPVSSHYFWTATILLHVYPRIFESSLIFTTFHDILSGSKTITFGFWYACIYIQW